MNLKFYFLLIIACLFAFTSCSSDNDDPTPPSNNEMIELSFNVKDYFTSEVIDKATKSSLNDAGIKVLQYRVLDKTTKTVVSLKNYDVTSEDLVIKDKLPAGEYWIFFIGCTNDFPLPDTNNTDPNGFEKARLVYLPDYKTQIFSNSLWLKLNTSTTKVEENITLQRNVGKIEIVIEDAQNMPENIAYLYPAVKIFYPNIFRFADWNHGVPLGFQSWGTLYPPHFDEQNQPLVVKKPTGFDVGNVPRSEVIKNSKYTMVLYMLDNQEGAVYNGQDYGVIGKAYTKLYIYGTAQKVTDTPMGNSIFSYLFEYEVVPTGVNVVRNKVTRLTGKLFEGVSGDNGQFKISVNNDWGGLVDNPYIK